MRIFRAIGLGLIIIILHVLVPRIFAALEVTTLKFFQTIQVMLEQIQHILNSGLF